MAVKKKESFKVTLDCRGSVHKFSGTTVIGCLEKLKPEMMKSTSILTVSKGKKSFDTLLTPFRIKRILINKTYRAILEKQINTILNG